MSNRWIDNFENSDVHNKLNQIYELIEELNQDEDTELIHSIELARLNKISNYIKELIETCDPELFPFSCWENLSDLFSSCVTDLKEYQDGFEIEYLNTANESLDKALSKVVPFVKSGIDIDNAAKKAFQSYSKTINDQIKQSQDVIKSANQNIKETTESINGYLEETEKAKSKIAAFEERLFESEDALQSKVTRFFEEINSFHKVLIQGDENETSVKSQIQSAKEEISDEISTIRESIHTSEQELDKLDQFYRKIFGSPSEDDENVLVGGLELELHNRRKDLDKFKSDQESKCKALIEEIEDKLPGATSAGLASAYKELKDSFEWKINFHTGVFYLALILLAFVSLSLVSDLNELITKTNDNDYNLLVLLPINIFWKLPLVLTIFWLALFSSKSRSQNHRLEQEYAHKEAIAKSYVSFKKQVEELDEDDENKPLMKKLLSTAIEAIALNASETLDKNHEDTTPLQTILEPIKKSLGKGISINIAGKE